MNTEDDYYVYCYIDPRNFEVFYYGKGRGSRSHAHLADGGDSEKARRIKQIKAAELEPTIRVVAAGLTEDQALLVESALIWKLGKSLTNKNAGHYADKFRPQDTMHEELPGFDFSRRIHFFNVGEHDRVRSWDDCRKFGFLSAGYGARYKRTAEQLHKGDIVVAYLSKRGYVGVGQVVAEAVAAQDFRVKQKPLSKLKLDAPDIMHDSDDPEKCEYVVKVRWLAVKNREDAVWKQGLFSARQTWVRLDNQRKTLRYLAQQFDVKFEKVLSQDRNRS